jgi:putative SOS response-associated peptidase YedK
MCGRFVSASPPDELARYFGAQQPDHELEANFNVAPTDEIYVVRSSQGQRQVTTARWGLVPFWAKEAKVGAKMINARSESVRDKPAFRNALRRHRCLIPADGFYEWAKVAGHKQKQPYFISRPDGEPLVFAGLWERWRPPPGERDDGAGVAGMTSAENRAPTLVTCTILTCAANSTMTPIHDRMPVLLAPPAWDYWLGGSDDPSGDDDLDALAQLFVPAPDDLLQLRPVTTAVNRVANNGPQLLDAEPDPLVPVE